MSGSGISWAICKSEPSSRQVTTPAPHHSVFYRPDALPATQPTVSKHWRLTRIMAVKWWLVVSVRGKLVSVMSVVCRWLAVREASLSHLQRACQTDVCLLSRVLLRPARRRQHQDTQFRHQQLSGAAPRLQVTQEYAVQRGQGREEVRGPMQCQA